MSQSPKHWKTVASKVLLDDPRLSIIEDSVELPDGRPARYIRHAPSKLDSVAIIAIDSDNRILIQQEYSHPPNKVMWQLPGGSVNEGETLEEAAMRELAEESGYGAKVWERIGAYYVHNRLSDKRQHVFVCHDLYAHKLPQDEDEFISSEWMSTEIIKTDIASGKFDNINLLAALNIWFMKGSV